MKLTLFCNATPGKSEHACGLRHTHHGVVHVCDCGHRWLGVPKLSTAGGVR